MESRSPSSSGPRFALRATLPRRCCRKRRLVLEALRLPRLSLLAAALFALALGGCAPPPFLTAPPLPPRPLPATPAPRARLPQQDISLAFDRGLWHLQGTLTLPERDEGARVPVAVIVHGSGPMSRDGVMRGQIGLGFGFDLPVYQRLAAALSARGYAVYRYDKRTCGAFNDCADNGPSSIPYSMLAEAFSTSEYVHDAEAALDAVLFHPSIDPDRAFFLGHSEGGQLVPVLLTERPRVRAGVMLAPPFHSMSLVLEQQSERVRWAFTLAGQKERGEIDARQLHDAAHALGQIERGTHLGEPILGQPPSMWASWIDLASTAPELARALQRPLLVLGGSYDYNVIPSEIEAWSRWLDASPRAAHRVRVLDCVTHALNCISQPDARLITADDIGHDLAPLLVEEIVRFLDADLARAAPEPR